MLEAPSKKFPAPRQLPRLPRLPSFRLPLCFLRGGRWLAAKPSSKQRPLRIAMLCAAAVELRRAAHEVVGTLAWSRCKRPGARESHSGFVFPNMNRHLRARLRATASVPPKVSGVIVQKPRSTHQDADSKTQRCLQRGNVITHGLPNGMPAGGRWRIRAMGRVRWINATAGG